MKIILLERIEKLGLMGDVVQVRSGYARNYLLPQNKARRATKENLALFENQRVQLEADNLQLRGQAEKVGEKLAGLSVTLIRQAGESGQLYGSVNTGDLARAITEAGFTISRNQVKLDKVIKTLGLHPVGIRLHPEVTETVTANVARTEAEAEANALANRAANVAGSQAEPAAAPAGSEPAGEEALNAEGGSEQAEKEAAAAAGT